MSPITRKEMYLAAAAGQDVALPVPVTREEMFLAKMAGQDVSVPAPITRMEMFLNAAAENAGGGAGGGASVPEKDVNFCDYDGTCLYAYSVEEAQALTELPKLPKHEGLICQGWNYDLETIKEYNRPVNVGAMYITDDETTRIYITLREGRTSPMLGVCPKGTVTVDWGDGTEPDVLTGTSTSSIKFTPAHEYTEPGDYIIQLTVDGEIEFTGRAYSSQYAYILRQTSSADGRNQAYQNAIQRIEIGKGVTSIGDSAFQYCQALATITCPTSLVSIGSNAFANCHSLQFVTIPNGMTSIGKSAFSSCTKLSSVTIPNSVTSIGESAFNSSYNVASVTIPNSITSILSGTFNNCNSVTSFTIPSNVTSIGSNPFPAQNVRLYDYTSHTAVPTLSSLFSAADDCEIHVPAALYDEWIAATNWVSYASKIVAV